MERVLAQGDHRPMADRPDAMAELRDILGSREPLYAAADLCVETSGRPPQEVLTRVTMGLQGAGWPPGD
jgi:XRE family aerobic/anaerobic benzoate catabolism transcriptional regulator